MVCKFSGRTQLHSMQGGCIFLPGFDRRHRQTASSGMLRMTRLGNEVSFLLLRLCGFQQHVQNRFANLGGAALGDHVQSSQVVAFRRVSVADASDNESWVFLSGPYDVTSRHSSWRTMPDVWSANQHLPSLVGTLHDVRASKILSQPMPARVARFTSQVPLVWIVESCSKPRSVACQQLSG